MVEVFKFIFRVSFLLFLLWLDFNFMSRLLVFDLRLSILLLLIVLIHNYQDININDWYFETEFRGHVREPIVKDLKLIMDDLELVNQKIYGRNFIGVQKYGKIFYPFGYILKYLPSFCSNIYILGEKG